MLFPLLPEPPDHRKPGCWAPSSAALRDPAPAAPGWGGRPGVPARRGAWGASGALSRRRRNLSRRSAPRSFRLTCPDSLVGPRRAATARGGRPLWAAAPSLPSASRPARAKGLGAHGGDVPQPPSATAGWRVTWASARRKCPNGPPGPRRPLLS
ncbi:dapper homolog 3-like [Zalophus californianus]|uniref:Dapper homolog 3-like n=1 Tax=Zalophus californianus TaxID=9704 RepID=A0A6P9F967_ZALCA|nr:dapper homolog 3-like [Zalophus californianus]